MLAQALSLGNRAAFSVLAGSVTVKDRIAAWRVPVGVTGKCSIMHDPGRIPGGRGGSGVYKAKVVDRETGVKTLSHTDEILGELERTLSRKRSRIICSLPGCEIGIMSSSLAGDAGSPTCSRRLCR